jgi:hypothetical protein
MEQQVLAQVWKMESKPISSLKCLGLAATSSNVCAGAENSRS